MVNDSVVKLAANIFAINILQARREQERYDPANCGYVLDEARWALMCANEFYKQAYAWTRENGHA